jgi:hypothetical protein
MSAASLRDESTGLPSNETWLLSNRRRSMFRDETNLGVLDQPNTHAGHKPVDRQPVHDELQMLDLMMNTRRIDDLGFFGLTRTNQEPRRHFSRMV